MVGSQQASYFFSLLVSNIAIKGIWNATQDFATSFDDIFQAPRDRALGRRGLSSDEPLWTLNDSATQTFDFEFIDNIVWPMRTPSPLNIFGINLLNFLPWFQLKEHLSRISNSSEL